MRITIDGPLGFGVSAKDVILAIIAQIGIGGARAACHRIRGLGHPRDDDGSSA